MTVQEDQPGQIKPYLVRAIHEWCTDQGFTPYLAAWVDKHTRVPREYVKDGQIVLNLGLEATHQLSIGNDLITFQARFNGVAQALSIPLDNVTAIYARENGQGMAFEVQLRDEPEPGVSPATIKRIDGLDGTGRDDASSLPLPPEDKPPSTDRPRLTRVK